MRITSHAYDRGKERLGLKRKSLDRMAYKALEKGVELKDVKNGNLQGYILSKSECYENTRVVLYGDVVYVFNTDEVLITLYIIPKQLREHSISKQRKCIEKVDFV